MKGQRLPSACRPPIDQRFADSQIAIRRIIWIASCVANPPEELEDFLREEPDDAARLFGCSNAACDDVEQFVEYCALSRKLGFLVQATTPTPHDFFATGNGYSASWGNCRVGWFYTPCLDVTFVHQLERWQQQIETEAKRDEAADKTTALGKASKKAVRS